MDLIDKVVSIWVNKVDKKIEKAIKRKANSIGKPSYIAPCSTANIRYWYKRNTLVFLSLIIVFSISIYALLIRQGSQDRFLHAQNFFYDAYPIIDLMDDFFAELILLFFLLLCIRNLFGRCAIRIVGEKGFAFVSVSRNGAVKGVNIVLFKHAKKLTITRPRGGIGLGFTWRGTHWSYFYTYYYHPFFENVKFINAVLENWHRFRILRDHRLKTEIK